VQVSIHINDEVKSQNALINTVDSDFESSHNVLTSTMRRLGIISTAGGECLCFYCFLWQGGNMRAMTGFCAYGYSCYYFGCFVLLIINVFYRQSFPMLSCTVRIRHLYCHLLFGWAMISEMDVFKIHFYTI
jgi:hypothetical protein